MQNLQSGWEDYAAKLRDEHEKKLQELSTKKSKIKAERDVAQEQLKKLKLEAARLTAAWNISDDETEEEDRRGNRAASTAHLEGIAASLRAKSRLTQKTRSSSRKARWTK